MAQVEATDRVSNEHKARSKTVHEAKDTPTVQTTNYSNGATIVTVRQPPPPPPTASDRNGRYGTIPLSEGGGLLGDHSSQKLSLSYRAKYPVTTTVEDWDTIMRSSKDTTTTTTITPSPSKSTATASPTSTLPVTKERSPTSSSHDTAVEDAPNGKVSSSMMSTPVSPPPSPPAGHAANGVLKPTAPAPPSASRGATPRPTEVPREPSPMPSNTVPTTGVGARGGSLASLLHADHRDVGENERRELLHGTPPSPDSLPQVAHSRNPSMADSNATAKDSIMKDGREEEEDQQQRRGAMDADHLPRSRSQPSPSPSSVAQQPYPHHPHVATQRHHSQTHASSRSQSDRPSSHPQPYTSTAAATQTPALQLPIYARSHSRSEDDGHDQLVSSLTQDLDRLHRAHEDQKRRADGLEAQLVYQDKLFRGLESDRVKLVGQLRDWLRAGEQLLAQFNEGPLYNGHPPNSAGSISGGRGPMQSGMPLSSAMVGASSSREYESGLDRDRTLSVVAPYSPVHHHRSNSGYSPSVDPQRYPQQSLGTPTHAEPVRRTANATRSSVVVPPPTSYSSSSLRRTRRPSSDDLAVQAGGKRIKTNNGEFIRVSPEAGVIAAYGREPQEHRMPDLRRGLAQHVAAPLYGRESTATSGTAGTEKRGSGSMGSGTERGRDTPSDRRTVATGREEDEEEFPSPRRSFTTPVTARGPSLAGNVSAVRSGVAAQEPLATVGEDADADGSPDIDAGSGLGAHQSLMELVEEDDPAAASAKGSRHPSARNGSRSSMASQDVDEMLAEAAGDAEDARYATDVSMRSVTKQRHRNSHNSGGVIAAFPIHLTPRSEVVSPGQTRSYTPTSQSGLSKVLPSGDPRDYVFRNVGASELEAQSQARSPEGAAHRHSFSSVPSAGPETAAHPSAAPVTMQFLPPQSGPPMPKKIYHNKGTGQVIGAQHTGATPNMNGSMDPASAAARVPANGLMTIDGQLKRTCKQCGQPGRYKDNKCVEKWGPGPQGPGTVCDRCRKKMKRVEKRATQDSAIMAASANHHHYPIAPAPTSSFSSLLSQGSQRFDETQDSNYSRNSMEETQGRPSLSRAGSQSYSQVNRRSNYAPEHAMRAETAASYHPDRNQTRETMPPPTSFSRASPANVRGEGRQAAAASTTPGSREGDADADGDAETDELMDDELGAAADASNAGGRHNHVKPETP